MAGDIKVGIGGWTYEPWRGPFFPDDLPKAKEMDYAIAHMGAIEVNGTYYRTQTPATYARWAQAARPGFRYALKALRFCTSRKILAEGEESVGKFLASGLTELGEALGPILWQFAPTKRFEADDFSAFLSFLPDEKNGVPLRHAIDARHESFACPEFLTLARKHEVAIVCTDSPDHPQIADPTTDFIYARLMNARSTVPTGYPADEIATWATRARDWAAGRCPEGLTYVAEPTDAGHPRDTYIFMINGAKERAPAAAQALMQELGITP